MTVAALALAAMFLALPAGALCPGDCDENHTVDVAELVRGVNVALGSQPLSACQAVDRSGDQYVTIDELVVAVHAALEGCPVEPIFPADYRSDFIEVRECRFSIEHGGVSVRVLANPIAAQAYLDDANPLPLGSIVLKEEFDAPDCNNDRDLVRWRVMRKEAPGFDAEDGDWNWQWVEHDRRVLLDDKTTCIGCHAVEECLARDYMCTVPGERGKLRTVLRDLPGALLSVAGTSATDVYVVGADPGDGAGPQVLHYDGEVWRRLATNATGSLWWISVTPIDGSFYMVGEGGLILRYDLATRTFTRYATPGDALLFGIWGASADALWAVGDNNLGDAVLWRFDGSVWTDATAQLPEATPALSKVWGRSASEVYAVGQQGTVLRFDGEAWSNASTPASSERPLFTVHGNDRLLVATGGFLSGAILESDAGLAFTDETPTGLTQMNGVFVPPDSVAVAVGRERSVALRGEFGWELRDSSEGDFRDYHATWIDPAGGIWAVGGDLSTILSDGVLAYGGSRAVASTITAGEACPPGTTGGAATVSFARDVVPLFSSAGCLDSTCHGGLFPSSGYDLQTYRIGFAPGDQAQGFGICPIVPGDPDASYLIEKIGDEGRFGVQMPSGRDPLTAAQIELLKTWIREGAQSN